MIPLTKPHRIVQVGKGSLVSSIITRENDNIEPGSMCWKRPLCMAGIQLLNSDCAKESTGHGSPMPMLVHGGPGRAGGGEEMGGKRGVLHYMQRTAIQGSPTTISRITNVFPAEWPARTKRKYHPFRKYFEELEVGDTLITAKHTVTETDIANFTNVSGDNLTLIWMRHHSKAPYSNNACGYFRIGVESGRLVCRCQERPGIAATTVSMKPASPETGISHNATIGVKLTVNKK